MSDPVVPASVPPCAVATSGSPLAASRRRCAPRSALALDVALPPLCPACREPVGGERPVRRLLVQAVAHRAALLRAARHSRSRTIPARACCRCEAIADPPAYDRARAAVRYDDIARTLVHALKYGDRLDLAPTAGPLDGARRPRAAAGADALVPVPLHWRRLWARRFNQSALLAKAITRGHRRAGRRRRAQARQGHRRSRSGCRRRSAPATCRALPRAADGKAEVAGRRLVLIDDVLTSGATADACARALLRAGAGNVDVLVFARVVDAGASAHIDGGASSAAIRPSCRQIEIYTTPYCPYCIAAKELLKRKGVAFNEIDVSRDGKLRAEMTERANGGMHGAADFHRRRRMSAAATTSTRSSGAGKLDPLLERNIEPPRMTAHTGKPSAPA